MPTSAYDAASRRPWVAKRISGVELQGSLQQSAGGPQVALGHALLREPRTEGVRWSDDKTLRDAAQGNRLETEAVDQFFLLGGQLGQRTGSA